jgi:hypothetical protein
MPKRRLFVGALVVIAASIVVWSDLDWGLLAGGGRQLVGAAGLHVYVKDGALQAGPVALAMFGVLQELGRPAGPLLIHLLIWLAGGLGLVVADRTSRDGSEPTAQRRARTTVHVPRWAIVVVALAPFLIWHLPPLNLGLVGLWGALALALGVLAGLPHTRELVVKPESLSRLELCALLTAGTWATLASGSAHLEDAVAPLLLIWAVHCADRRKYLNAALCVGIAIATKPWAVAGIAVLLRRHDRRLVVRDLVVAAATAALAWLPFVLAAPGTLHAADRPFTLQHVVPMALFLHSGVTAPHWMRTVQLLGIVVAAVAARRSSAADAVAAGMCARLLLDPGSSTYYLSSVVLCIAAAELVTGRRPHRLVVAVIGLWVAPFLTSDLTLTAATSAVVLLALIASYVVPGRGWQRMSSGSPGPVGHQAQPSIARQGTGPAYGTSASISGVSDDSVLGTPSSSAR